jgi:hypothetical protein
MTHSKSTGSRIECDVSRYYDELESELQGVQTQPLSLDEKCKKTGRNNPENSDKHPRLHKKTNI